MAATEKYQKTIKQMEKAEEEQRIKYQSVTDNFRAEVEAIESKKVQPHTFRVFSF